MSKLRDRLESLPGKIILLHSGYGGGQYLGGVKEVKPADSPRHLLMLMLEPETWRYQPMDSSGLRDYQCYWQKLPMFRDETAHNIPLKRKDRLYLVGDSADLGFFEKSKEPINPENPEHVKRLAGKESLELLYGGSELLITR